MTEEKKRPKFVIVDGSNYLFRAFYAIRELSNSKGFPTNAIYGFTTMLMKLLRDQQPEYIAVAFDVKGPTFRHEAYDAYKATRKATPDTLIRRSRSSRRSSGGFRYPSWSSRGSRRTTSSGRSPAGRRRRGWRLSSSPATRT